MDYWTPQRTGTEWPRLDVALSSPNFDTWKNSSFLRVQDISFSYNFNKNDIERLKIKNLKAYISLRNYFTITKWNYWDPESGGSPMPKYFTIGVNATL